MSLDCTQIHFLWIFFPPILLAQKDFFGGKKQEMHLFPSWAFQKSLRFFLNICLEGWVSHSYAIHLFWNPAIITSQSTGCFLFVFIVSLQIRKMEMSPSRLYSLSGQQVSCFGVCITTGMTTHFNMYRYFFCTTLFIIGRHFCAPAVTQAGSREGHQHPLFTRSAVLQALVINPAVPVNKWKQMNEWKQIAILGVNLDHEGRKTVKEFKKNMVSIPLETSFFFCLLLFSEPRNHLAWPITPDFMVE